MTSLRQFRCAACGHEFAVPYGTGRRGREMTCPACGQAFVHRLDTGGRGRGARRAGLPVRAGRGFGRRN